MPSDHSLNDDKRPGLVHKNGFWHLEYGGISARIENGPHTNIQRKVIETLLDPSGLPSSKLSAALVTLLDRVNEILTPFNGAVFLPKRGANYAGLRIWTRKEQENQQRRMANPGPGLVLERTPEGVPHAYFDGHELIDPKTRQIAEIHFAMVEIFNRPQGATYKQFSAAYLLLTQREVTKTNFKTQKTRLQTILRPAGAKLTNRVSRGEETLEQPIFLQRMEANEIGPTATVAQPGSLTSG